MGEKTKKKNELLRKQFGTLITGLKPENTKINDILKSNKKVK